MVTAGCLLYLDNSFAAPTSLKSTKLTSEINLPVVSDLTKFLIFPPYFFDLLSIVVILLDILFRVY